MNENIVYEVEEDTNGVEDEDSSTSNNLKIGDIVYLEHSALVSVLKLKKDFILSGDGIAGNKLGCISKDMDESNNAYFQFKKCLFRVETSRKYYHQKLYKDFQAKMNSIEGHKRKDYEKTIKIAFRKY